ncbi:hypothetical protein J7S27_00690 [Carnobacteriaceae bacterium zg-C25]|nr:hypothetical protein J7S27_00690 [Carnobacteriaceae bacterium zg-C25]
MISKNKKGYASVTLTWQHYLTGGIVGGSIFYMMMDIVYKQLLLSVISAVVGVVYGVVYYRQYLNKKHDRLVLFQFNDLLDSLFNSYAVGKNTLESFKGAEIDLLYQHPKTSLVYQEVCTIVSGLEHGYGVEELLLHFAQQVNPVEIHDFVDVFNSVYRRGGDLRSLMLQSKELITKKIAIELDILTIIHEQKQQVMILLAMPYVLLVMMEWFGLSQTPSVLSPTEWIVRTIAVGLFISGYVSAKRIVERIR